MAILNAAKSGPTHGGGSFSVRNRAYRALWILAWRVFASWTPAPLHGWRRAIARVFGAKISRTARIDGSVRIWSPRNLELGHFACLGPRVDCYNMATVRIGDFAIVSQDASLCGGSHDLQDEHFQLVAFPINIDAHAWIASGAFVGPGVTVHEGAVLGARGVATKDLAAWTIYVGNPVRPVKPRPRPQREPEQQPRSTPA
jgi:putative colanic acid biosynthesis acetyltransferase WcaF